MEISNLHYYCLRFPLRSNITKHHITALNNQVCFPWLASHSKGLLLVTRVMEVIEGTKILILAPSIPSIILATKLFRWQTTVAHVTILKTMWLVISQNNIETAIINDLPTQYGNDVKVDVNQSFHSNTVNPIPPTGLFSIGTSLYSNPAASSAEKLVVYQKDDDSSRHTKNETNK